MSSPSVIPPKSYDALLSRVAEAVYPIIGELKITAWSTPEPVSFAERRRGTEKNLTLGDSWARQLFDCAWFRFSGEIPVSEKNPLVLRIDINGELCLVDSAGSPVRGLTCISSVFDRSLGTPAKTVYFLPPELCRSGSFELWADAGLNDLFGSLQNEGRIVRAHLCSCRQDLRALHYDLEIVTDLQRSVSGDHALAFAITDALQQIEEILSAFTPQAVAEARKRLAALLQSSENPPALQVSAIGHAHLDLAWLWPIRETIRKGARTFATALYNIDRYPEYIFGCSQPQLFVWIKVHYPALYERIKAAVVAGRIELLGSMWVEPDCNIPSGESLVRQVLHGARFFAEEFGIAPRFCWQPDVFGYNAQLPQILKKSGHDFFMTQKLSWNLVNRFPHHSFRWEALDGSYVLSHMLPEETYNGPAAPRSLAKIAQNYAQRDVSTHALMVFGIGDGGGGPDAEHLERLRRTQALADLPRVKISKAADFFCEWSKESSRFPSWSGELYLERHQGTFTTQARTKLNNRRSEVALGELEWIASLAAIFAGQEYPADALDRIWKEILLYQFHDILPGSSIKRVYDECMPRYAQLLQELEQLSVEHYAALAARVVTQEASIVFNSLPWSRREWIQIEHQWFRVDAPAMGYTSTKHPFALPPKELQSSPNKLENQHLCIEFGRNGRIASFFDKDHRREIQPAGEHGNHYVVFEDLGDAWDFPSDYAEKPPRELTLESSTPSIDGPCAQLLQIYTVGTSRLEVRISLKSESRLLEFQVRVLWRETKSMLRVRFPVAIESSAARFEIPYGSVTRSTRSETTWEKAQIEVPAHQWVDLSQADYGVALLNNCKYGFRVKDHCLDMNLIRSVPHPGQALINKEDTSDNQAAAVFTDLGEHTFGYALWPHAGPAAEGTLTACARKFNVPLRVIKKAPHSSPTLGAEHTFIQSNDPDTEITALKRAEDGDGWIIRLNHLKATPSRLQLRFAFPVKTIYETDLLESKGQSLLLTQEGRLELSLSSFEVKTLRLCL